MGDLVRVGLAAPSRLTADRIAIGCFTDVEPDLDRLPANVVSAFRAAAKRAGWSARAAQRSEAAVGSTSRAVTAYGLGRRDAFDERAISKWLARLRTDALRDGLASLAVVLPDHERLRGRAPALRLGRELSLFAYRFDGFKSAKPVRLAQVRLIAPRGEEREYRRALALAAPVASGVALARDLANTPPNVATPAWMAAEARRIAAEAGFKARVLGPRELERRKMGGLLAVGGGSSHGPRLVRLEGGAGKRVVALVGKGITFDTGGISIKPAASMDEMKYDKSGACTVLGIVRAAAELDLGVRIRAYLPLAENMPDGASYRPGDIVRCYGGTTVEIKNTDAEGRMVLADALTWAARESPDELLEFSTLTGATVVALGRGAAAVYTPDDDLAEELTAAAGSAGERLWRMPLWPEYGEAMKGVHADLKNSGVRWGGANQAAAFLAHFVTGVDRWAHLDIAGPAYVGVGQAGPKGATGYGVAGAINWLLSGAGRL